MIFTHNTAYFEYLNYGTRQIAYFTNYPALLAILLTIGVWGAVAGSILLIFRSRWAVLALAVAFVNQATLDLYTFVFRDRWIVLGPKLSAQDVVVLLLTLGMLLYARSLRRRRVIN